jgi:hypothetical protein
VRIVDSDGQLVWERPTVPWEQRLAQAARAIGDLCRDAIGLAVQDAGLPSTTASYGVSLIYVDQGSLHAMVAVGLEEEHRAAGTGEEGAMAALYIEGDALEWIDEEIPPADLDVPLLREACMAQTDDPYRVVLGAVARDLADADLPGLRKTEDFVAWVAEHDEGFDEKFESIRLHNPPDAVARWESGWGADVLPFGEANDEGAWPA